MISQRYPVSPKLKSYKVQELLFSCLRSKVCYEDDKFVKEVFRKKDLNIFSPRLMNRNDEIRKKVQNLVNSVADDMHISEPIYYDGLTNKSNKRDSQGFLIWKKNTIYISFRGTRDFHDIIDVIDIRPKKLLKDVMVHSGFAEQFFSLQPQITKDIKNLLKSYPIERLVFTGHSMGGSIAAIAAAYYGCLFEDLYITCHTFGTPLTGNDSFIEWYKTFVDESTRLELESDIVPLIPINKDFKHIPNGVKLKKSGSVESLYEVIPKSYAEIVGNIIKNKRNEIDDIMFNHSCEQYVEHLLTIKHVRKCSSFSGALKCSIEEQPKGKSTTA